MMARDVEDVKDPMDLLEIKLLYLRGNIQWIKHWRKKICKTEDLAKKVI
jgi:hypothetical protein